jgi:hypothetical protein
LPAAESQRTPSFFKQDISISCTRFAHLALARFDPSTGRFTSILKFQH